MAVPAPVRDVLNRLGPARLAGVATIGPLTLLMAALVIARVAVDGTVDTSGALLALALAGLTVGVLVSPRVDSVPTRARVIPRLHAQLLGLRPVRSDDKPLLQALLRSQWAERRALVVQTIAVLLLLASSWLRSDDTPRDAILRWTLIAGSLLAVAVTLYRVVLLVRSRRLARNGPRPT